MRYLSVCSGIEAATVAWKPLGWKAIAFSEVDKFPCTLLSCHYPDVPNLGDMRKIDGTQFKDTVDVLVGGTPCQSFSIAGQRKGLEDERGDLSLEFVRLANEINPAFIVWENVPGVLSDSGNAFGAFLGKLSGEKAPLLPPRGRWTSAGYVLGKMRTIAWRILDAQYFGVPQRRKRIFLIASPRSGYDPREILFEFDGVRRSSPPSRSKGQEIAGTIKASIAKGSYGSSTPAGIVPHVAGTLASSFGSRGGAGISPEHIICQEPSLAGTLTLNTGASNGGRICPEHLVYAPEIVQQAMTCHYSKGTSGSPGDEHHNLVVTKKNKEILCFNGSQDPIVQKDMSLPCTKYSLNNCVLNFAERRRKKGKNIELQENLSFCLVANHGSDRSDSICDNKGFVRRLTPLECERLQGFPDNYTNIPSSSDSSRYKALGNSMAVPVMHWIGERIAKHIRCREVNEVCL